MNRMRRLLPVVVLLLAVFAMAAADVSSRTGWVTDAKCASGKPNAECSKKCIAAGEPMVFVDDANKTILTVANPKLLEGHEGHHVKVQGTVENDKLTVSNVEMLPDQTVK
jgi:hypothetical protein